MKKEQGVNCEELWDLEVGYEFDYFNHVPLGMLTAYGLQGYVFYVLGRYRITT